VSVFIGVLMCELKGFPKKETVQKQSVLCNRPAVLVVA